MATPADQRLLELCDKWLKSLELHIRYSSLDTDSYWKVQPWPEHQRPSRWIIDLAVQKTVALRAQVQERIKQGDTKFSDSLELMTFLANLIGSEHIERFIPLAERENEVDLRSSVAAVAPAPAETTQQMPTPPQVPRSSPTPPQVPPSAQPVKSREIPAAPRRAAARQGEPPSDSVGATATREMPEFVPTKRREQPVGTQHVARTERRPAPAKPSPRPAAKQPAKVEASEHAAREQVVADAARLVQWGRKWYELPELIARMAGRPPLAEVRKILKDNKTAIEKQAGRK